MYNMLVHNILASILLYYAYYPYARMHTAGIRLRLTTPSVLPQLFRYVGPITTAMGQWWKDDVNIDSHGC